MMNNEDLIRAFEVHDIEVDGYLSVLSTQENRVVDNIKASLGGDWGGVKRIRESALVLRQVLLHRAIELTKAAGHSLVCENGYSLALSVRAHFETTASIGYLHYRLNSMKEGNISAEEVDRNIVVQLLGSRDKGVLSLGMAQEFEFEAKQILNMLKYADKSVSKRLLGGAVNEHKMLFDSYSWLCEFYHPNFHSNKLAFNLNLDEEIFNFRHGTRLKSAEANIIKYLDISGSFFIDLYDEIECLVT